MSPWNLADLLPGLWVLLVGALLVALLRRFYDPVPWPALVTFAALLLVLFAPELFRGRILLPLDNLRGGTPFTGLAPTEPHGNFLQGDLIQLVAPSVAAVRRSLAAGRWPQWNDRVGAGMPLLADPQAQALQPLVLVAGLFSLAQAAGVTSALRVLVALLGMFLLLRRQGLGSGPATAGAVAYGLGGFLLLWVGWPLANSAALLPCLLYALLRIDQCGGRRDALLLAATLWAFLLAGHPETIAYGLGMAALVFASRLAKRPKGRRRAFCAAAGVAALVAAGAAAPLLVPAATYLPQTMRATTLAVGGQPLGAEGAGSAAVRRLLPVVAPNAYGNSRYLGYWGDSNTNEDASGFAGTAALLLLLAGLGGGRRLPEEPLVLGTTLVSLLLVARPPWLASLLCALPLLGRWPSQFHRLLLLVVFGVAYLAACALTRFTRDPRRRFLPVIGAALGLGALILWAYLSHGDPSHPGNLAVLRMGWLRWQLRALVAAAALLLAGAGRRWLAPAFTILLAGELCLLHLPANPPAPKRLVFPVTAPVAFLQQHAGADRVVGLGFALLPNLASLYGLSDVRTYNPAAPALWTAVTAPVRTAWSGEIPVFGRPEHPLYALLGVRWVMASPGMELPSPLRLAFAGDDGWVYERPGALRRMFLPNAAEVIGDGGLAGHLGELRDWSTQAIVAPAPGHESTWRAVQPEASWLGLERLDAVHLVAEARLAEPRLLVSSVFQDGGWVFVADGARLRPTLADGPFAAAWLPQAARRVDLLYRAPGLLTGCLFAALALAVGAALWAPAPAGGRGQSPSAPASAWSARRTVSTWSSKGRPSSSAPP